jgi:hypothetical protein
MEEKICGNCVLFSNKMGMCFNIDRTCERNENDSACDAFVENKKHDDETE